MAAHTQDDVSLTINSVDLTPYITGARLAVNTTTPERIPTIDGGLITAGGSNQEWTLEIGFVQDFAASATYATLFPLIGTDTAFVLTPTGDAVGATNPSFTGTVRVQAMDIVSGDAPGVTQFRGSWPVIGTPTVATS